MSLSINREKAISKIMRHVPTKENVADDATKWPGDEKRLLTDSLWDYVKNSLFQGDV